VVKIPAGAEHMALVYTDREDDPAILRAIALIAAKCCGRVVVNDVLAELKLLGKVDDRRVGVLVRELSAHGGLGFESGAYVIHGEMMARICAGVIALPKFTTVTMRPFGDRHEDAAHKLCSRLGAPLMDGVTKWGREEYPRHRRGLVDNNANRDFRMPLVETGFAVQIDTGGTRRAKIALVPLTLMFRPDDSRLVGRTPVRFVEKQPTRRRLVAPLPALVFSDGDGPCRKLVLQTRSVTVCVIIRALIEAGIRATPTRVRALYNRESTYRDLLGDVVAELVADRAIKLVDGGYRFVKPVHVFTESTRYVKPEQVTRSLELLPVR